MEGCILISQIYTIPADKTPFWFLSVLQMILSYQLYEILSVLQFYCNNIFMYYIWEISNNSLLWFWGFVGSAWWWSTSVETCNIKITGINRAPCWTEQCVFVRSTEHDGMDTVKLTCSNVGIIKLFYVGGQEVCPRQWNFNVSVYQKWTLYPSVKLI